MIIRNGIVITDINKMIEALEDRELNFLLGHYAIFDKFDDIHNTKRNRKIELIKQKCNVLDPNVERIEQILDQYLIAKINFDTIDKDDLRKIIFLIYKLSSLGPADSFHLPLTMSLYDLLIYTVDISHNSEYKKIQDLSSLLKQYDTNRTQESQMKWLNFQDNEQMIWAINYLNSKYMLMSFFTIQNIHRYKPFIVIMSSLDCYDFYTDIDKKQFIQRMSKSWSQKKFIDAGKTKTKHHLPLTKKAKAELKKLANFKNKSESDILEELVGKAYLNEMCDDEGKALY